MPTLVTVPPPTGAKSHASGPEVLLMVLEGGAVVCAEAVGALRNRNKAADTTSRKAAETKVRKGASRMKPPRDVLKERQSALSLTLVCAGFLRHAQKWLAPAWSTSRGREVTVQSGDCRNWALGKDLSVEEKPALWRAEMLGDLAE